MARSGWSVSSEIRWSLSRGIGGQFAPKSGGQYQRILHGGSYFDFVKNINIANDKLRQWAEGDYMPNMPTSRYGLSAAVILKKFGLNLFFDRYLKQRYLGKSINPEPAMPPYSMVNARVSYAANIKGFDIVYYISGSNLLNTEARPQNSLLKYLAPLPGKNISFGVKAQL